MSIYMHSTNAEVSPLERAQCAPRLVFLLLATFILLLTGCGSSGSDDTESADSDSGDSESGDSGDSDESNHSDNLEIRSSPLDEFLGVPSFDPNNTAVSDAQFAEEERSRQEAIATCMRAEGFDYTPEEPLDFNRFESESEIVWGSEQWIAKFGFGVTTMAFSQTEVGPELIGYSDGDGDGYDPTNDPNFIYVESLSEAEQEAYRAALWGQQYEFDPASMTDEEVDALFESIEYSGCQNKGQPDGEFAKRQAFYEQFGDEVEAMEEAMRNDPRIVEREAEIETCVLDKGVEYIAEQDAYESLDDALSPIRERTYQPLEDPASQPDFENMSDEEIDEFYSNLPEPELSDEDKALLGELQQDEIATAMASFECGGGYENQIELFNDMRVEYEQRFLEENQAELETFAESN